MEKVIHLTISVDLERSQGLNINLVSPSGKAIFKSEQIRLIGDYKINARKQISDYKIIGWLFTLTKLSLLYNLLFNAGFIQCSFEIFESHFLGRGANQEDIKWYGASNALTFLISELLYASAIPPTNSPYLMTSNHFIKGNGEKFDNNRLRKNHNKGMSNNKLEIHLTNIVKSLMKD